MRARRRGATRSAPIGMVVAGAVVLGGLVWIALQGGGPTAIEDHGPAGPTADGEPAPGPIDDLPLDGGRSELAGPREGDVLAGTSGDPAASARAWEERLAGFEAAHRARIESGLLDLRVDDAPRLDVDAPLFADLACYLGRDRVPLVALAAHGVRSSRDARIHALMLMSFALHDHARSEIDRALLADIEARLDALTAVQTADGRTQERVTIEIARATGEVLAARRARPEAVALVTKLALLLGSPAWREHEDALRSAAAALVAHHPGEFDTDQLLELNDAVGRLRLEPLRSAWHAMLARSRDANTLDVLRRLAGTGLGNFGEGLRRLPPSERDVLLRSLAADAPPTADVPPDEELAPIARDIVAGRRPPVDAGTRLAERSRDRERAFEGLVHLGRGVLASATAPSIDPTRSTRDELVAALGRYGAPEGLEGLCELAPLFAGPSGLEPALADALRRSLAWYVFHPLWKQERAAALELVDALGDGSLVPPAWRTAP